MAKEEKDNGRSIQTLLSSELLMSHYARLDGVNFTANDVANGEGANIVTDTAEGLAKCEELGEKGVSIAVAKSKGWWVKSKCEKLLTNADLVTYVKIGPDASKFTFYPNLAIESDAVHHDNEGQSLHDILDALRTNKHKAFAAVMGENGEVWYVGAEALGKGGKTQEKRMVILYKH